MLNACTGRWPLLEIDPVDAECELAELFVHADAAAHRQCTLLRFLDTDGHWHRQGAISCAHWLSWPCGLALGAAREKVRVARALGTLPAIDDALRRGAVSFSKVRAMTRVATPENESRLLEMAQQSTASQLERICRSLRRIERDEDAGDPADAADDRGVRLRDRGDGTVRFEANLLPDEAQRVMEALRAVRAAMSSTDDEPDLADALVRMADTALADAVLADRGSATRTMGPDRADVIVHLTPDALGEHYQTVLDDGTRVSAETFRRVACDCGLLGVSEDERGSVLDVGRKTRSIPPAIHRAVRLRDRGCAFPGCPHDRFLDIHHAHHWIDGGETKLDNLVALCTYHHRLVHEGGWRIGMHEGAPQFIHPTGSLIEPAPCPTAAPTDALAAYEALHEDRDIDDETGLTRWDGSIPDYAMCVSALCANDDDMHLPIRAWLAKHSARILSSDVSAERSPPQ